MMDLHDKKAWMDNHGTLVIRNSISGQGHTWVRFKLDNDVVSWSAYAHNNGEDKAVNEVFEEVKEFLFSLCNPS